MAKNLLANAGDMGLIPGLGAPTCHGATSHVPQLLHLYSGACALRQEKPPQLEARALHLESSPHLPQLEKSPAATKAQHSQKKKTKTGIIHYEQLKFIPEM